MTTNNMTRALFKPKLSNILYLIADIVVTFAIIFIAFLSHYGTADMYYSNVYSPVLIYCSIISVALVIVFYLLNIYRILTKDIGLFETLKILVAVVVVQILGIVSMIFIKELPDAASFFFTWLLSTITLAFSLPSLRVASRLFYLLKSMVNKTDKVRTLVIGAGASGKVVVDESRRNKDNHNLVVAFVDDDVNKIGGSFANLPVKGPISEISTIIEFYNVEEVVIAISELTQERLHEILTILDGCPVRVKRLPTISEMEGPNDTRIIDVDLNDLLSRDPIVLDNHEVNNMLRGMTVMVTGAGGSIGSELVRQIYKTRPKNLILFDIYENSTYDIQMELMRKIREEDNHDVNVIALIGSTYNEFRVEQVLKQYRPDYIYHAAAYKHVPLMEDSPAEAIRTNVIGTYNVARLADKYKVKKMVLVSTDKAVRPTNVMGATKRFAETIIQHYAKVSKNTAYAAVRFGNVLGSNGSVVPLFKKQIEAGGPITITDKRITRFFMTIPEAVSLILQCGLFAKGGEIFILDMGQPVKILHLAERLIRQAGKVPGKDIEIIEVGLRPGEKLYEELLLDKEHQTKTENKKIFIEPTSVSHDSAIKDVEDISKVFNMERTNDVKKLLAQIITTYTITDNKK